LDEYTRDLRDPEGFKKAVILSEILNRRHFWVWKIDFLTKIVHSLGMGFFRAVNFL
jgi:AAA15 family ATPase/GTPase